MRRCRVALVGPEVEENLSLRYLASSLTAAGHSAEIVPFDQESDLPRVLAALTRPSVSHDLIGLSLSFQWRAPDFLAVAVALREEGFRGHITAGGHFGTFAAAEILRDFPELDSICMHEAEETIVRLANQIAGTPSESLAGMPGLAVRTSSGPVEARMPLAPPDLARLPWPDRRGAPATCLGHPIAPLVSSRGCYARCAFCCIAAWHEKALPGTRYRSRPLDDVADEMAWLERERGVDIFVFHDDDFFVPGHARALARIHALADALERRGIGRFATVVKARPNDVDRELFTTMQERLGLIRVYLGIETDSEQGLATLHRGVRRSQNHEAMALLQSLSVYVCFNMLIFDPDTTAASLRTNLEFMEEFGDRPLNFGRAELYAGTPLLARMLEEGRCQGDYLGWDYALHDAVIQRTFETAMRCFFDRNFAGKALANQLMGTRFDVEVCRTFHPDLFEPSWLETSKRLSRTLAADSAAGLRSILESVETTGDIDPSLEEDLTARLRATEERIEAEARELEAAIRAAVEGRPLRGAGRRRPSIEPVCHAEGSR